MEQEQSGTPDASIRVHVTERRDALRGKLANAPADGDPLWGLALSGGGIRSATFALGLVSGLARKQIFHRFDVLSTVSGGGYAGSALGKLYNEPGADPGQLEAELGDMPGSWFVWWLRATSRYLTPRGAKDMLFALTLYARNLIAVHTEMAVVFIAAGALLALLNLAAWWGLFGLFSEYPTLLETVGWMFPPWMSTYWLLLLVPGLAGVPLASAYWTIPSRPGDRGFNEWVLTVVLLALALIGVAVALGFPGFWAEQRDSALRVACLIVGAFLGLAGLGPFVAWLARRHAAGQPPVPVAEQRNRLTNWLRNIVYGALVLLGAGALDRAAWWIVFGDHAPMLQWLPAVIAVGVAIARSLASQVPTKDQAAATSTRFGFLAAQAAGWLLFTLLLVFWVSVAYRLGLVNLFGSRPLAELQFPAAAGILCALTAVPFLYVFITGKNEDFANLSSLHMFYRARLTRSYLGAANRGRFGRAPLDRVDGDAATIADRPKVYDVVEGDSVKLSAYAPHRCGGPVHILNATINQTQAALGGLFNQDRKGQYLSISSDGLCRVGLGPWQRRQDVADSELPAWMAISGAAFAPGLGGQTSTGLALLLFVAGVRLGYWWDTTSDHAQGRFAKYALLLDEARAKFQGAEYRYRYLSDGGHFENTAAYTLLRERARLIVLSDAGADPAYGYADVENLVRKARIDLLAEIRFLGEAELRLLGLTQFGSIDQLRDPDSDACIALARVDYAGDAANPTANAFGWIVYVKPNMSSAMPVDLRNYARDHPPFPQEPTADQFFSESQWESYFILGRTIGMELDRAALERLAATAPSAAASRAAARPAPILAPGDRATVPAAKPPGRFGGRAALIATSGVSITAVLAIITATWQAWDKYSEERAARKRAYESEIASASAIYEHYAAGESKLLPDITSKLAGVATLYCTEGVNTVHSVRQAVDMLKDVQSHCKGPDVHDAPRALTPACAVVMNPKTQSCIVGAERQVDAPAYWAIDYSDHTWAQQRLAMLEPQLPDVHVQVVASAASVAPSAPTAAAAAPAPAAPAAPAPAPATAPAAALGTKAAGPVTVTVAAAPACSNKLFYIQVYSPIERPKADEWSAKLRLLKARVPAIEDVSATAARNNTPAPRPVNASTLIYHTPDERACADALQSDNKELKIRPLGRGFAPTPGVLELWIPPSR